MIESLINGETLKDAADVIIDVDDYTQVSKLRDGAVIWAKTECINNLFHILSVDDVSYSLITHCADHAINESTFFIKPKCIKKWYAQNVDFKHPDLIPIPIGVENHIGRYKGSNTDFNALSNNTFDFSIKNKVINKVYCNFRDTHFNRGKVRDALLRGGSAVVDCCSTYLDYVNKVKEYLFIASPRGNGIDCHRTWEALYFGSIPLVDRHFMYDSYKDLPIIQVDDWNNLPVDEMREWAERYKNNQCFRNVETLTLTYWVEKIRRGV